MCSVMLNEICIDFFACSASMNNIIVDEGKQRKERKREKGEKKKHADTHTELTG